MGIVARLFKKAHEQPELAEPVIKITAEKEAAEKWETIPAYIEASSKDYQLVSIIATAIATGEQPASQFIVKKIMQRNPEAKLVSLIVASVAAGNEADQHFIVQRIATKK